MFRKLQRAVLYAVLIGGASLAVMPLLWMLIEALRPNNEIYQTNWIPSHLAWGNFVTGLTILPFGRFFLNSAIITGANVLFQTSSSTLVAYGFARFQFRGRTLLFSVLIATLMIPSYVTLIPIYVEFSKLGWVNTFLPLIVPGMFGNAYYIFLLRQFIANIPREMDESAKVDGCGPFSTLWRILLPQSLPALATVIIFTFFGVWNDFLSPLIYVNSESKFTAAVGLQYFAGQYTSQWNQMMAVSLVVLLPCLLVFFFAQKVFIQGIVVSGSEK